MNTSDNDVTRWTRQYRLIDTDGATIQIPVTVEHDGVPVRVYRVGEHRMIAHTLSGDVWLPPERYGWRITADNTETVYMETQQHRVNRYASPCAVCGALVPALGGSLRRAGRNWEVRHPACAESGAPSVIQVRTSGWTGIRNRRGTCEDAPCCGCCTF